MQQYGLRRQYVLIDVQVDEKQTLDLAGDVGCHFGEIMRYTVL